VPLRPESTLSTCNGALGLPGGVNCVKNVDDKHDRAADKATKPLRIKPATRALSNHYLLHPLKIPSGVRSLSELGSCRDPAHSDPRESQNGLGIFAPTPRPPRAAPAAFPEGQCFENGHSIADFAFDSAVGDVGIYIRGRRAAACSE